jgi:hypothetical protein
MSNDRDRYSHARTNAREDKRSQFVREAKQYAGNHWNQLTTQERELIISDIEKTWSRSISF